MAEEKKETCENMAAPTLKMIVNYGNAKSMINIFRKLLNKFEINETIFNTKIQTVSNVGRYYSKEFERSLLSLRVQYLHLFLIHYPPSNHTKTFKTVGLYNEFCHGVSRLCHQVQINAVGEYYFTIRHLINLTEVMAIGAMIYKLEWYAFYKCPLCGLARHNFALMDNPVLKCLASRYKVSPGQITLLVGLSTGCCCRSKYNDYN